MSEIFLVSVTVEFNCVIRLDFWPQDAASKINSYRDARTLSCFNKTKANDASVFSAFSRFIYCLHVVVALREWRSQCDDLIEKNQLCLALILLPCSSLLTAKGLIRFVTFSAATVRELYVIWLMTAICK